MRAAACALLLVASLAHGWRRSSAFLTPWGGQARLPAPMADRRLSARFLGLKWARMPASTTALKAAADGEKSRIPDLQDADNDGLQRLGESKLIYDPRRGRFFEKEIEEICREEYCARDEKTGEPILLTVTEKERIFLDCIQSYYYNGRQILSDDDFNKLKEDLVWEGSKVAYLNRNETLFLSAMSAYLKGTPIISDEEFDSLKRSLKEASSPIAVSTEPKCLVDTGICTVTFEEDTYRKSILYLPAVILTTSFWLTFTFEVIEPIRNINPIITLGLGSPFIYLLSKYLTENVFFNNPLIASGPCPACNVGNRVYFGDILGVEGFKDIGEITCKNCGTESIVQRSTLRVTTLPKDDSEDPVLAAARSGAPAKKKKAAVADDDE